MRKAGWNSLRRVGAVALTAVVLLLAVAPCPGQTTNGPTDPVLRIQNFWQLGDRAAAHAVIDSLLPIARVEADTLLAAHLLILRGLMHTALGNGSQGEAPLKEGLTLVQAGGDPHWEMIALRWLGVAYGQNLRDEAAHRMFARLRDLAGAQSDTVMQAWAETGLAYQDHRAGQVTAARDGYTRAVALFREGGEVNGELFALNGLGNVLNWLGEYAAARKSYEETLAASRRVGATFTEALAANNIGTLDYSLGDPGRALANFRRARDLQLQDGNLREATNASHNIAICLTFLGDYDQALAELDQAVQVCRARGFRELEYAAQTQKGLVLAMQGRLGRAVTVFRDLETWPDPLPAERTLEMVLACATTLGRQERHAASLRLLQDHAAAIKTFRGPALRLAYLARMGQQFNDTGQPRAALNDLLPVAAEAESLQINDPRLLVLPEMARAYLALGQPDSALIRYREAAAVWEHERGVPLDPQWRERRGMAGQSIYTELAALILAGHDTTVAAAGRVEAAYRILQAFKGRTLLERMVGPRVVSPERASPVNTEQLQHALAPEGEVLLDYFLGQHRSFLFVVTRGTLAVQELAPAAELEARVGLYRDLILAPGLDQERSRLLATSSAAIEASVLRPAAKALATNRRVVFCPDGGLNRLPAALVLQNTGADHVVQRIPSASILVRLRAADPGPREPLRHLLAVAGSEPHGGRTLAAADREVAWLNQRFAGVDTVLPDSVAAVAALARFDLLHIASHARVSDEFPWRSTIFARTADGQECALAAADIAEGKLGAGLTVLAGCESAGGKVVRGEGVMGLSSAFIAAGSPTVLASLWPIDDAATYHFMQAFYADLATGATAADACRQAQAQLAERTELAAPRFWAGFVIIGDGNRSFEFAERHYLLRWQALVLAGIVLLLGAVLVWRRQISG